MLREIGIDQAAFKRNRFNADNLIDYNNLEHAFGEKPLPLFRSML
jgi:hypothetical protein